MLRGRTRRSLKALASATAVLADWAELLGCGPEPSEPFSPADTFRRRSAAGGRTSLAPDLLRDTFAPQKVHSPPVSARMHIPCLVDGWCACR